MGRRQHLGEDLELRPQRVAQERGYARERFVALRIQHMQDDAGQQRRAAQAPVVLLSLPFRVDENLSDVLRVAYLARALAHLEHRVEGHAALPGRLEPPAVAEAAAPAGG